MTIPLSPKFAEGRVIADMSTRDKARFDAEEPGNGNPFLTIDDMSLN